MWIVDGEGRQGCQSPKTRPGFVGSGPYHRPHHRSLVYPWEVNPGPWNYPLEPGPSVGGQFGPVTRTRPFNGGIPHPLPHLQVKGHGPARRRTVSYVCMEEEEGCTTDDYHSDSDSPPPGGLILNGHCGLRPGFSEGGWETENHQDWGRVRGRSEEASNGCAAHRSGFFPTEVPQDHLNHKRRPGACVTHDSSQELHIHGLDVMKHRTRHDSVRDQIRQVVTDLEDVLGGLKQVHTEMKEVVEQIDRLTAGMDIDHENSCVARGSSNNIHSSGLSASLSNHRSAPSEAPCQHVDEGRVILRTNSPSPVHTASVVKTRRFTPPSLIRDVNPEKLSANGHLAHLHILRDSAHIGLTWSEPRPHTVDPKVIVRSSTNKPRTHKPPPYPHNGHCGRGLFLPAKSECRNPPCTGRGRQNSSAV